MTRPARRAARAGETARGAGVRGRGGSGPRKPPKGAGPKRGGGKVGGTKVAVAVLALVLVGAAGFSGYKFLTKSKAPGSTSDLGKPLPTTSASASAATAQCVAQFGQFCHIQTRELDPAALTVDDLYPAAFFSETAKAQFVRSGATEDKDCAKAVIGTDLTKQLKTGQCNQVLRATYLSGDGTIMGTIGVINLSSTNQAHYAGKIIGKANFIMPLAGTKGPTAKLGKGTGVVEAQYKGHYLILTWAEFVNQQTPSTTALTPAAGELRERPGGRDGEHHPQPADDQRRRRGRGAPPTGTAHPVTPRPAPPPRSDARRAYPGACGSSRTWRVSAARAASSPGGG